MSGAGGRELKTGNSRWPRCKPRQITKLVADIAGRLNTMAAAFPPPTPPDCGIHFIRRAMSTKYRGVSRTVSPPFEFSEVEAITAPDDGLTHSTW